MIMAKLLDCCRLGLGGTLSPGKARKAWKRPPFRALTGLFVECVPTTEQTRCGVEARARSQSNNLPPLTGRHVAAVSDPSGGALSVYLPTGRAFVKMLDESGCLRRQKPEQEGGRISAHVSRYPYDKSSLSISASKLLPPGVLTLASFLAEVHQAANPERSAPAHAR